MTTPSGKRPGSTLPMNGRALASAQTALRVPRIRVQVVDGPDQGLTKILEQERITVGTGPGNDVVLSDAAEPSWRRSVRARTRLCRCVFWRAISRCPSAD